MVTEKIDPELISDSDADFLSDMICEIITQKYGMCVKSLYFSIEVSFELDESE